MDEDKLKDRKQIKDGLLITMIFFIFILIWTVLFLFIIPEIQKKFFLNGTSGFIEFQSDNGFFTIFGYFCFALLAVTLVAIIFTPSFKSTKGVKIFISILVLCSLLGVAESLLGYRYLTKDGAVFRYFISTGEKKFKWDDLKKIEISFYNTSTKPRGLKGERMIKVVMIFDKSHDIVLRESASGESSLLRSVFSNIKNSTPLEIDKDDKSEWETVGKFYNK